MASIALLRFSSLSNAHNVAANIHFPIRTFSRSSLILFPRPSNISINARYPENLSLSPLQPKSSKHKFPVNAELSTDSDGSDGSGIGNGNTDGNGNNGGGSNSGGRDNDGDGDSDNHSSFTSSFEILRYLLYVWRQFRRCERLEEFVGRCCLGFEKLLTEFGVCLSVVLGIFFLVILGICSLLGLLILGPFGLRIV